MKVNAFAAFAMLLAMAGAAACARAGGETGGGELTEAGTLANTEGEFTGDPYPDVGTGSKWSDLYRDYFAATEIKNGKSVPRAGSCSFKSSCHGSPEAAGAKAGNGIKCFDKDACYASVSALTKAGTFVGTLRRYNDRGRLVGFMPKEPGGYFSDVAMARIQAWIDAGSNND